MMTYDDAVAYLDSFTNYEHTSQPRAMRELKLERIRRLCRALGDPQRSFRSVLITGTNGKGSIAAMLYAMLRESSLRAGFYCSPHLEQLRERFRAGTTGPSAEEPVHGADWIREEEFAAIIEQLRPVLEPMRREAPEAIPTHFEVLTAVAFLYFQQRQVHTAVLEIGMGGRLDATNVVDQAVSVLGPIDVDHPSVLGYDPVAIAKEKAGIIKPGQIVLTASQPEGVLEVLRASCEEQGCPLFVCGRDLTAAIQAHSLDGLQVTIAGLRGIYESLEIPLIGRHQAENAALAVAALEALADTGIPYSLVERGLSRVEWPGRTEVVHEAPLVIMDGAHNPHAEAALAQTLTELCPGRRIHLLVGMSSDKSPESLGRLLGGMCVSATCTRSRHPRAMDPLELAQRLSPFCPDVHAMSDSADAYTYLLNAALPADVIIVTGSLFLVGELRGAIRQSHIRPRRLPEVQAT